MRRKVGIVALIAAGVLSVSSCSRKNNLLFGRVETEMDGHNIVVTDCYRFSVAPPVKISANEYRFEPCKDAVVVIRDKNLTINGQSYGSLTAGAAIVVDHGVVSLLDQPVPIANNKPNS